MPYTQKVADTLKKVVTSVNAEMPGIVEQIILYGSYARGDIRRNPTLILCF